jgi:hypothetical protein
MRTFDMTTVTPINRFGQAISGGVLLLIAVTAGATGFWINVHHGLEVSTEAGILYGLSDLTRIVLPIVCGLIGWSLQTRLVAIVCVVTSVFCVLIAFTSGADRNLAGKQHGAEQYTAAKARVKDLEDQVASLDKQAAAEAKNKGCGKQCKYLGERADKARQELTAARTALKTAAPVAIGPYELIASRISAVLFLVLIESLVWMSVPAMTLLVRASKKPPAPVTVIAEPEAPNAEPVVQPVAKKPRKARKTTREVERMKRIAISSAFDKPVAMTKKGAPDKRRKAYRRRVGDDLVVANDA